MEKVLLLIPPSTKKISRDTGYGCWHEKKFINYNWPPTNLIYLKAVIEKKYPTMILDLGSKDWLLEDYLKVIGKFSPTTIIVESGTYTLNEDIHFLEILKKQTPKIKVILFGQHPTVCPVETLSNPVVDILIRGDIEGVINQVIQKKNSRLDLREIPGVCFRGKISQRKVYTPTLDKLPIPKRKLGDSLKYSNPFVKNKEFTTVIISRGCPHKCSFCTVPSVYGDTYRHRSVENVMEELKYLENLGFKEVVFRDENLAFNKEFITNLCNAMNEERLNLEWSCNARVDSVNSEILKLMEESGCHLIKFGVESGSQERLNFLKKGTKITKIKETFEECNKLRIDSVAHCMLGNLGETIEDMNNTVEFVISLSPTYASFDMTLVYPKTELYKQTQIKGINYNYLVNYDVSSFKMNELLTGIPREELKKIYESAFKTFYLNPGTIVNNIIRTKSLEQLGSKVGSTISFWKQMVLDKK